MFEVVANVRVVMKFPNAMFASVRARPNPKKGDEGVMVTVLQRKA